MKQYEADECAKRILAYKDVLTDDDTPQTRRLAALIADARKLAKHMLAVHTVEAAGIPPGHPLYEPVKVLVESYGINTPTKLLKGRRA